MKIRPLIQDKIPKELIGFKNWVCWRLDPPEKPGDKPRKTPVDPHNGMNAKSNDPATWADFDVALAAIRRDQRLAGIGFEFTASPFSGIDLDHCVDKNANLEPWAADIVHELDSYGEISPSGTGVGNDELRIFPVHEKESAAKQDKT